MQSWTSLLLPNARNWSFPTDQFTEIVGNLSCNCLTPIQILGSVSGGTFLEPGTFCGSEFHIGSTPG